MKPLVSIIIVSWNGEERLKKCLPTLAKQTYPRVELIFVDNGSTDKSLELLNKYFPKAKIIRNQTNLGFAYPNNQGLEVAEGEYIYLLNNDTTVEPDFLEKMVEEFEINPEIDIAQSKILLDSDKTLLDSAGAYITKTGFLMYEGLEAKDSAEFSKNYEIFFSKGAAMMVRKKVTEKIGLFDPRYFAYFEEADFCWRAHLAGFTTWFVPASVVYHELGQTNKKLNSDLIDFHSFKNRLASLIKNLELKNFYIIAIHKIFMVAVAISFLLRLKPQNSLAIFKALLWNLWNLPATWQMRGEVNRHRKLKDEIIFQKFGKGFNIGYFFWLFRTYVFKWR